MLHEMETKAFLVDGVGNTERNKNNRKTLFKCPFIKSIISLYFFFLVEVEAKMINFLRKVFFFCCFFRSTEI